MPAPAWAPSPSTVAALLSARLDGEPFDATTRPTAEQLDELIAGVAQEIHAEVGAFTAADQPHPPDGPTLGEMAYWAAALGVAAYAIDIYWPEQQADAGDVGLDGRYREQLARLRAAVAAWRDVGGPGAGSIRLRAGWVW